MGDTNSEMSPPCAQISEIVSVESADTFKRPIYAGNVIATVKSTDAKKVITVRATAFDAAPAEGGSATVEAVDAVHDAGISARGKCVSETETGSYSVLRQLS